MNKYRLLYVVESFGGGVFTYLEDLCSELYNDFDIMIAYGIRSQTPINFKSHFHKNVSFIQVKNFNRSINPIKEFQAYFEIKKIAKDYNPDLIHLHSSKAGVLGRFAYNGKRIPLFYTPHGYSFLMANQSKSRRALYRFIEKISALRKCTTISCSKGEHEETLRITKNAIYINNGIDINKLNNQISNFNYLSKNQKSVFTLGRICYQKNPIMFNQIALEFPDLNFIWIGDGELKNLLNAKNIEITGWLNREDALKKAMESDIFLLTSLWEGLPISLLESMYMKKVCVVSDAVGNRDVIRTSRNGYLCATKEDFFKAIKSSISTDNSTIVETARKDVEEKYNKIVMGKKYKQVYLNSIESKENVAGVKS